MERIEAAEVKKKTRVREGEYPSVPGTVFCVTDDRTIYSAFYRLNSVWKSYSHSLGARGPFAHESPRATHNQEEIHGHNSL